MSHDEGVDEGVDKEDWTAGEFGAISLGDSRFNQQAIYTISKLAEKPHASINQACGDWKSSKAAYHLLDHEKVTTGKLIETHQSKTVQRIQGQPAFLCFAGHKLSKFQ
jgi:hypothetical protein